MEDELPPHVCVFPCTVLIDTREQRPFTFRGIHADSIDGGGILAVASQRGTIQSGDYSFLGMDHRCAVERKSLSDLYSTISQGRERFVRELERLDKLESAAVVIEAEWSEIMQGIPQSKFPPKTVFRSVIAWQSRYRVHWIFCPGREFAEVATFRFLERFWRDKETEQWEQRREKQREVEKRLKAERIEKQREQRAKRAAKQTTQQPAS